MDQTTTNVLTYCAFISSIGAMIVGAINHRRIRSKCCGHEISTSIDIESTTPPMATTHPEPAPEPPLQIRVPTS